MLLRHETRAAARTGFTLMEMLVVVAILVVLAGTGGVIYMNILEGAKKDAAKSQARILAGAVETYRVKYGDPPSLEALAQPTPDGKPLLEPSALVDPWGRPYQMAIPGPHHPTTGSPDVWSMGPPSDPNAQCGNW